MLKETLIAYSKCDHSVGLVNSVHADREVIRGLLL